ncbi:MAG: DNA starvation/stationary phase protection protein Dps [Deltaproteobacteria bacterium]|nr:DNA starvation/stationary phase protection protein Dps [Deltaproteobacteria bacterium]
MTSAGGTMRSTKNDLSPKIRKPVVKLLNANLADAIHLSLQAKQAHWNVKGQHFFFLHGLFDKVYEESVEWVDALAERAVQLGGVAEGTLDSIQKRTRLAAYDLEWTSGKEHLEGLSNGLSVFGKEVREAIGSAVELGDADTADLFTEISREVDKMLWFCESHLGEVKT